MNCDAGSAGYSGPMNAARISRPGGLFRTARVAFRNPSFAPGHGRGWLLLAALLLSPVMAVAAPGCDDLLTRADELSSLRDVDPARGVEEGRRLLEQARRQSPRCTLGESMLMAAIGRNLHILGRVDEAIPLLQDAMERLPEEATTSQRAGLHRTLGVSLADAGEYVAALEHYLDALADTEASGDILDAAKSAGNIGNLYNTLNEFDLAREYHQKALAGFSEAGFREGVAGTYVNLGAVALKLAARASQAGDPEGERRALHEALENQRQALRLFVDLGNERGEGHAETNIAHVLSSLGRREEALPHFERALALHHRIGDHRGELNARVTLADMLTAMGRYAEAREQLELADGVAEDVPPGVALQLAGAWVTLHEALGEYAEALRWHREVQRLSTVLADEQYNARVLEFQARFDTRQQAKEIELLRSQAAVQELELWRQRMILGLAIAAVLAVAILVGVLYSRLRLGQRVARELERAARTDPLTGLANRRHMVDRIERAARAVEAGGDSFAVIMIDIDRFKAINDRHGHGIGDQVLQEVGRRLGSRLRHADLLARWGGEEFLVLLPGTDLEGGQVVAENLRNAVSATPMQTPSGRLQLSISLGVCAHAAGMGVDECISRADQAMYAAKRSGGNGVGDTDPDADLVAAPAT